MDPRELKQLLKDAKEGLKKNDYMGAAKACKTILKKEPDHYQANLLLGTSFREQGKYQQALEAYKKATQVDENQVYAWQGVISVYEKQNIKVGSDLLDAYKKVATHFEKDDKQKYIENTLKLANILVSQNDNSKAMKVIGRLAKSCGLNVQIAQLLVQLLNTTTSETRSKDEDELYTQALDVLVTETPQPAEETYRKFFSQLYRNGYYAKLADRCAAIRDQWNHYYSPMEWICRLYLESKIEDNVINACEGIEKITDRLFKLHPSSRYGYFARGKYLIESACRYAEGFSWIVNALESSYNLHAAMVLVRGKLKFGDFEGAQEEASKAIANCNDDKLVERATFKTLFELLYWEGLIATNETEMAEQQRQKLEEVFKDDPDNSNVVLFLDLSMRTTLKQKQWDELADIVSRMEALSSLNGLPAWKLDFYKSIRDAAKCEDKFSVHLNSCLQVHNNDADMMLESGIFLFDQQEYEAAAEMFARLVRTKEGSSHPHTWKYLGLLASLEGDLSKAIKYLKKSYELNLDSEVGALLADVYEEIGDLEAKKNLLNDAIKKVRKTKSKWAWARLGLMQLHEGNLIEAVESLQSAIRVDLEDGFLWESLADAYFHRGSLQAALRCYKKAMELGVDPVYSKMRISAIFQFLEEEDQSIAGLKELLDENPNNSMLHVELARLYCWVASEKIKENFDKGALYAVEKGLDCAVKAILFTTTSKPLILPWLIIGDFSILLGDLPENTDIDIFVPALLSRSSEKLTAQAEMLTLETATLSQFKEIGTKALLQGLQIMNNLSQNPGTDIPISKELFGYVYHQLALSFYKRAISISEEESKRQCLLTALSYGKKAVAKSRQNSIYWNTVGLIAFRLSDAAFAQHCYIKALQADSNNVVAWGNLGMLYYEQEAYLLAHKAFAKGQSVAPIYANSWIGQGLCAEVLQSSEAPDLFRHACLLRPHPFAIASYGNAISDLLLKSEDEYGSEEDYRYLTSHLLIRMDAVTHLYDLISRIESRAPSPQIYNLKGIVAGCNGFHQTALESFNLALNLPSSTSPLSDEERLKIQSNKVSSLVTMKNYNDAKEELTTFPSLDVVGLVNAALSLYKLGDAASAIEMYQRVLTDPEGEKKKSDVKIALALLVNSTMGVDAAKSILFGKDMIRNPRALLTLGAIAVTQNDLNLLRAVIHELQAYRWTPKLAPDLAFMHACSEILQKSTKTAVKAILKFIHMYPTNAKLYALACQVLLTYNLENFHVSVPRHLALCTLKIAKIIGTSREEALFASKHSGVVSLTYLVECNYKVAIMATLKAIKCYPEQRDNWAVLACSYWMEYSKTNNKKLLLNVINILDREIELGRCSPRIHNWMSSFRVEIAKYSTTS